MHVSKLQSSNPIAPFLCGNVEFVPWVSVPTSCNIRLGKFKITLRSISWHPLITFVEIVTIFNVRLLLICTSLVTICQGSHIRLDLI